jgi:hypothetical protein
MHGCGKKKELDYTRLLPRALWAIRCANVRSGILPTQSRLRGNDEQKTKSERDDTIPPNPPLEGEG